MPRISKFIDKVSGESQKTLILFKWASSRASYIAMTEWSTLHPRGDDILSSPARNVKVNEIEMMTFVREARFHAMI